LPARIAFCITTLEAGGAERQLVELATRLPRDRFDPAVVVLAAPPRPPTDELVRKLAEHEIAVSFLGGRSPWQAPLIYRRLANWLRQSRPDLLQCFLAHANVLGACAGHRLGIPVVAGIRVAEQRLNGHRALQRWTAPLVNKHVCVSQSVAEFAERVMRLPREKLVVIPNGIDVARFIGQQPISLAELGVPPDRRMILFIGRLEPDKRPAWLVDRMPALAARLPNHDLMIVGRGPLEGRLRRQAAKLGVADRVHFVGWRPDVPQLLAAADLLALTSTSEGMPNVILEAMAAARPVVTTEVYGVQELLGSDHDGQITPTSDTHAFVDAVAQIAADRDLATRLGQRNRGRAADLFSLTITAAHYAALYDALVNPPQ
jgi:glycosyltransferase involved in cell wall biosynthesis